MKKGSGQKSMARLLLEMAESPQSITRRWYRKKYTALGNNIADLAFDTFAKPGADFVERQQIESDLEGLKQRTRKCEEYADRRVAHFDTSAPRAIPTYNDLEDAIQALESLYVKYYLLLQGSSLTTLLPTRQYDPFVVFRTAWVSS